MRSWEGKYKFGDGSAKWKDFEQYGRVEVQDGPQTNGKQKCQPAVADEVEELKPHSILGGSAQALGSVSTGVRSSDLITKQS